MTRGRQAQRLALMAGLFCLGSTAARAGIPVPCLGEKIVKVADLPSDMEKGGPAGIGKR